MTDLIERLLNAPSSTTLKANLDRAEALDQALGFPASTYPTIHIAGSNGKGSVTAKIGKVLELSGYRVGVYTSPHLFSLHERIQINNQWVSNEEIEKGLAILFSLEEKLGFTATFFELMTFLALDHFRKKGVDVAVIETGLGGRLDATNVIHPLLTVITSISREHTALLGDSEEAIAAEKAGILKEGIPVVLGPKARTQSIYDRATTLHCPVFASKKISYFFDEENSAIAEMALQQLRAHFSIPESICEQGLSFRPPCRFEVEGDVIFDVAHNPGAIFSLLQALHTFFPERKYRFIVGFSKDKEYDACLNLIASEAVHLHLVQAASPRAASSEELKTALAEKNPLFSTAHTSVGEGVKQAYAEARTKGELLVICGSFYIMSEAKEALKECTFVSSPN